MNKVFFGDCRESMRQMIADGVKVQMCVTSPPYFGLRDYGTAKWVGGDPDCGHIERHSKHAGQRSDRDQTSQVFQFKDICGKCGALRIDEQLGLESTPEEYIANMVEVFGLVRELLVDDGVIWVNIGDSYATGTTAPRQQGKRGLGAATQSAQDAVPRIGTPEGLKAKDLIGIPWMLAFALRADGWYLRQDIIWHKPNPMPESVTDRCTKAHEYIFLLSKSQKYFFDSVAIKELAQHPAVTNKSTKKTSSQESAFLGRAPTNLGRCGTLEDGTRNKRSVWTVATAPYSGAHFAVYPPELIEPCILAGSRPADIVLDPFFGSGTTGQVAIALGRQYIGCELNRDYEPLQIERTRQSGLLLEVA